MNDLIFPYAGNEKIIKLLLQNDATIVNAVDKDGHTALDAVNTATEGKFQHILSAVNQRKRPKIKTLEHWNQNKICS